MEQMLEQLIDWGSTFGIKLIAAIAIFVIGRMIAKGISKMIKKVMVKKNVDETISSFVSSLTFSALFIFASQNLRYKY